MKCIHCKNEIELLGGEWWHIYERIEHDEKRVEYPFLSLHRLLFLDSIIDGAGGYVPRFCKTPEPGIG